MVTLPIIELQKLLVALVLPSSISALLILFGLTKKRIWIVWLGFALLVIFGSKFTANFLVNILENGSIVITQSHKINVQADVIVVLSSGLKNIKKNDVVITEWGDPNPYFMGIKIFRTGSAPYLIFTGGRIPGLEWGRDEGSFYRDAAVEAGNPSERIKVTSVALNTDQEAEAVHDLCGSLSIKCNKILLVTSAFHMPRAKDIFISKGFEIIEYPVSSRIDNSNFQAKDLVPSPENLAKSNLAAKEMFGRCYYFIRQLFLNYWAR